LSTATLGQNIQASELPTGTIVGTVTDVNHDPIPGASVVLESPGISERPRVVTDDNGYFEFHNVKPGVPSRVSVSAGGFADWQSPVLMIEPGQFELLAEIQLRIATQFTTVAVTYDPVEVATEQVKNEEQQRIFGFIPNYYVVYDPNPAALTAKLKFQLAFKVVVNPVTFTGVALLSGAQQAGCSGVRQTVWRQRRWWFHRYHDWWRHIAIAVAPGSPLLLPRNRYDCVQDSARSIAALCL